MKKFQRNLISFFRILRRLLISNKINTFSQTPVVLMIQMILHYEILSASRLYKSQRTVSDSALSLKEIFLSVIEDELKNLNAKNANTFNKIPTNILNENIHICNGTILRIMNNGEYKYHNVLMI